MSPWTVSQTLFPSLSRLCVILVLVLVLVLLQKGNTSRPSLMQSELHGNKRMGHLPPVTESRWGDPGEERDVMEKSWWSRQIGGTITSAAYCAQ